MRCSKCGTDNAEGSRFCNRCGTSLSRQCPQCATENAPESRFCSQCGTQLDAAERAARAGLAILDAIAKLNEQRGTGFSLSSPVKLSARVGIDSGAVVPIG